MTEPIEQDFNSYNPNVIQQKEGGSDIGGVKDNSNSSSYNMDRLQSLKV
jgi:hypothetical protein